jgi:hypothetical protein
MASKRAASKAAPVGAAAPLWNVAFVLVAVAYGLWLLVLRGRLAWPPDDFLNSLYTVAGCLALIGPLVLLRRDGMDGSGVGDLVWLTGGLLVWVFDLAAVIRGEARGHSWATPLGAPAMGLTILAVLVAGWRAHGGGRNWSWTNVTGWALGVFWVGMGLASLIPVRVLSAAAR